MRIVRVALVALMALGLVVGTASAPALNVRYTRTRSTSSAPSSVMRSLSDRGFGVSIGPKHP